MDITKYPRFGQRTLPVQILSGLKFFGTATVSVRESKLELNPCVSLCDPEQTFEFEIVFGKLPENYSDLGDIFALVAFKENDSRAILKLVGNNYSSIRRVSLADTVPVLTAT